MIKGERFSNAPLNSSEWFFVIVLYNSDDYCVQIAYPFTDSQCPVFIRTLTSAVWNDWRLFNQGTATAAQVLSGYTFSSANGVNLSGTMTDNGAVSASVAAGGTYTIPAGYHNGSGTVTAGSGSFTFAVRSGIFTITQGSLTAATYYGVDIGVTDVSNYQNLSLYPCCTYCYFGVTAGSKAVYVDDFAIAEDHRSDGGGYVRVHFRLTPNSSIGSNFWCNITIALILYGLA